jgi:hypothetical protein
MCIFSLLSLHGGQYERPNRVDPANILEKAAAGEQAAIRMQATY